MTLADPPGPLCYPQEHTLEITEQTLNFLRTGKIIIQIWGNMEDSPQVASNENVEEESDPALDAEIAAKRLILKELEEEVAGKMRLLAALL